MSAADAIRQASVFDPVESDRLWVEELGFTRGTVTWIPNPGQFDLRFAHDVYTVAWGDVDSPAKLIQWCEFPFKRYLWGSGPQLDDFFQAWLHVWDVRRGV